MTAIGVESCFPGLGSRIESQMVSAHALPGQASSLLSESRNSRVDEVEGQVFWVFVIRVDFLYDVGWHEYQVLLCFADLPSIKRLSDSSGLILSLLKIACFTRATA